MAMSRLRDISGDDDDDDDDKADLPVASNGWLATHW
jgi:hypothetical protein